MQPFHEGLGSSDQRQRLVSQQSVARHDHHERDRSRDVAVQVLSRSHPAALQPARDSPHVGLTGEVAGWHLEFATRYQTKYSVIFFYKVQFLDNPFAKA